MSLEIACFNLNSALRALEAGVDRIELCGNLCAGGSTANIIELSELLEYRARQNLHDTPVHAMIRPRGGDFVYSEPEFNIMKATVVLYATLGVDGFVFGILTEEGEVDVERCTELVHHSQRPCTFHRAFDIIPNKNAALEDIIECGFTTILTSGSDTLDVVGGIRGLATLIRAAQGRIEIMPGGGLRGTNLDIVRRSVHATWWHSSADVNGSGMADEDEIESLQLALERPYMNGG